MNTPSPDIVKAKYFAEIAHAGQTYNDEVPYTVHLEQVVQTLDRFGIRDPSMVCAAWLHDVIEDTGRSYNDIRTRFGEDVAEIVFAVTSELGRNRKERNIKTYPKIRASTKALVVKLADRIANVNYGLISGGKTDMYAKEFEDFFTSLNTPETFSDPTVSSMWKYLANLLKKELP
jgi:(p)ppGpp synthase/HD superfamily hydrolase